MPQWLLELFFFIRIPSFYFQKQRYVVGGIGALGMLIPNIEQVVLTLIFIVHEANGMV